MMPALSASFRCTCIALLLLLPFSAAATDGAGLTPEDYYAFQFISSPELSPDGSTVAFVRGTVSEDRRSRETSIWLVPTQGDAPPRRFTRATSDRSPRWSPNGEQIAFLSSRDERTQLHLISAHGGEAEAITRLVQGSVSNFAWLPDNRHLLLTLDLDPAITDPEAKPDEPDTPRPDLKRLRHAVYKRDGSGYIEADRLGLWLLDSSDGSLSQLTGDARWNDHNAQVSPDGKLIAFNADRSGDEYDGGFNQDLFLLTVDSGEVRQLETAEGRSETPVFSHDGRHLYYRHQTERYSPTVLHRVAVGGGASEVVHDGLALTAIHVQRTAGSHAPVFVADQRGARPLFRLERNGNARLLVGADASVGDVSFSADGRRMAFIREDEVSLGEVWTARADGSRARQLTDFNGELLANRQLGRLERFSFDNEADMQVDGFLLRPLADGDGSHPVVLNIKGGPGGMWGHQWFHEFQMLRARGYAVIFTNYRGSSGYGHDFSSAVRLDYGGADYRDNMLLVDAALERFASLDPERLYVTGGSHGGFLTNLITTRTERFLAAVTQRSVSNWISEAGTQAYPPRAMEAEFGGTLWSNFDYYWDRSPLKHADRVTTPTLVIHSDGDHITPLGQGQEWFYALLANGVPTELAMFEGESHGLSRGGKPVNLVARLELILEWFERYAGD